MEAAKRAQKQWSALTGSARGRILYETGRLVRANADAIAELECRSAGRPIRDMRGEAVRGRAAP